MRSLKNGLGRGLECLKERGNAKIKICVYKYGEIFGFVVILFWTFVFK